MRTTTRSLAAALAATLLIAACGSDSDDTGAGAGPATEENTVAETTPDTTVETTPSTTEPTVDDTTTTEAPAQDAAADTAAAAAALLTLADFPEGWTEAPSAGTTEIADRLAECLGVDSLTSNAASAASADFSSPDGALVVSQSIGVTPTEQDARFVLAGLTNPDVPECLAAAYNELGEGTTLGEATASRLAVGAAGDATQAIRVEFPTADGASTITVDHVVSRSGRSISVLTFEGRAEATAVETIDSITEPTASRLPA